VTAPSSHPLLVGALAAALAASGCAGLGRKQAPPPKPLARPAAPVDSQAQQKAYDRGVSHFSEEGYPEAKKAWQEAVRLGPGTPVGRKAQENLTKVGAILKSLQEIEGKQ